VGSAQRLYDKKFQGSSKLLSRIGSNCGDDGDCEEMARKELGCEKKDFTCYLKLQWYCYKSVAWIRQVKTENPSVYATVKCVETAVALCCL
jgi:hypothetical protein